MNNFLILLTILFSQMAICNSALGNPYEGHFRTFVNGVEKEFSYSESLKNKPKDGLSERALEIHSSALAVYNNPTNEENKIKYIQNFPSNFEEFLAIFNPPDFGQLYSDSYLYLNLLDKLADEFPEPVGVKLLGLAKHACFDADAPSQYRMIIREFKQNHSAIYKSELAKLNEHERSNFELFLKASFHPHDNTEGFCK